MPGAVFTYFRGRSFDGKSTMEREKEGGGSLENVPNETKFLPERLSDRLSSDYGATINQAQSCVLYKKMP